MIKENRKHKKFRDFNETKKENYYSDFKEESKPKIKEASEYKTPLQSLHEMFPSLSIDTIEDIYIENKRNFLITKQTLELICEPENKEKEEVVEVNSSTKPPDNTKAFPRHWEEDISHYANFKFEEKPKKNPKKNKNKKAHEPKKNETDKECELDDLFLDESVNLLSEFFPNIPRIEIVKKICQYDFDIDKVVLSFFNCSPSEKELDELEDAEILSKEEILSNFSSFNSFNDNELNLTSFEKHNLQLEIENQIKDRNTKNPILNDFDKNYPSFKKEEEKKESNEDEEEYFLNKEISKIESKKIREDLIKLSKDFPFEDEFTLKWVYFQCMNYAESHRYLLKNGSSSTNYGLKGLLDSMDTKKKPLLFSDNLEVKEKKSNLKFQDIFSENLFNELKPEEKRRCKILMQIIGQNPANWKFDCSFEDSMIDDYNSIRKKLIYQARLAFTNKKYQDAKAIMAKVRRYKQEVNKILDKKKIRDFIQNNRHLSFQNLFNTKEHYIDLHSLSVEESKLILQKKLLQMTQYMENNEVKSMTLCIIVGVGSHSKNKTPVLLPKLSSWLSNGLDYKVKLDEQQGIIKVLL